MALDPRIILAGQQVTPTDPNEEAIKAGQASDALALARQRIQSRQDDAAFSTAMQQAGGDPDKAITLLQSTNPRAALTYGAMITKQRQDNLKLAADQSDFLGKQTDAALKLFQGVGNDPKQYQIALRGAFGILHDTPVGDQLAALPQNPTPDEIPGLVDSILQKGMSAKDYHEQITSGLKTWLGGDPVAGLAHMLEVTDDPQMRQSIIQSAKTYGAPDAFVAAATSLSNQVAAGADPKTFRQLLGPQKPIEVPANATMLDPLTQKPIFTAPPPAATPYQVESLAERTRHDKAMEAKAAGTSTGEATAPGSQTATGDEYLASVDPNTARTVKALAEGRMAFPTGTALRTPYWQNMIAGVMQYDPAFDSAMASNNARQKVRNDFTSGASAKVVNAINTAIGHVNDLKSIGDQLGNTGYDTFNTIRNAMTRGGSPRGTAINNFNLNKDAVADELTRVYRQAGGSEQDIQSWKASINAAKSPQELMGAWKTIGGLLESKLAALQEQYQQGMGRTPVNVISDSARRNLDTLEGKSGASQTKTLYFNGNGFQVTKQPDGNWKSASGAIYDDSGKRIR